MTSYKDSGVDIDAGNKAEELIGRAVQKTYNKMVVSGVGGFGAVYSLEDVVKMKNPLLVCTMDGVGTKLVVASMMGKWTSVGKDIVNHCSNDLLAMGAKPLFFLDYVASAKISPEKVNAVVSGMAQACREINCPLVGGETAEMPGVYRENEHDIVGCMVGVVGKSKLLPGKVEKGDLLLALPSNGLHTNGYSLARKVLFKESYFHAGNFVKELGSTVGEALLKPHKSYSNVVLGLAEKVKVKAIAHITGGGLEENLPRVIPKGLKAEIDFDSIKVPPIFGLIQKTGRISRAEMFRTFNMGVGLVVVVSKSNSAKALRFLKASNENAWVLGKIVKRK